ncbi:major facilitator superfamily domain-containing protein [Massariosphaeria phaeospora]|uniref:Major facilitator superfamily domain-containing protein n=1 Tax=Massariosphaeria phaeospora TaxID=100035 RepID=A0A7C8M970_9PLEO|nr:major facilitator superfamily domain-containing protein [Massariosphaeria phaeospora]
MASTLPATSAKGDEDPEILARVAENEGNVSTTPKKSLSFYLSFLSLSICMLIVSLDVTALTVALPVVAEEFHGTTIEAFWASIAALLAVVIAQPIYTSLSDVLGRKVLLYAGYMFFALGAIVFSTAKNMGTLIAGRALLGWGGGGLQVLSIIILADMTTLKERPFYLALYGIPLAGGSICGPIVGAAFAEFATWRWIGWLCLPIAGFGFLLGFWCLKLRPIDQSFTQQLRHLDWIGMILFAGGCTLFALPLSWAGALYPWSSWRTIVPFIVGFLMLTLLAFYERNPRTPVFPYRIFSNRTAASTLIVAFLHGSVLFPGILYTPLFFQAVHRETPFRSAISMLPICCSIVGFSIIGPMLVQRTRKYRWVLLLGWTLAATGVSLCSLWQVSSPPALSYGLQVLAGSGIGMVITSLPLPMQASVQDANDAGLAVGIMTAIRLFGGVVGLAVSSTLFNQIFASNIARHVPLPDSLKALEDVREAIGFIPLLRSIDPSLVVLLPILETYRKSMVAVFLLMGGLGALGAFGTLFMEELTLENEEMGRQRFDGSSHDLGAG